MQITLNQPLSEHLKMLAQSTGQTPTQLVEDALERVYPLRSVPTLDAETLKTFADLETSPQFSDDAIIQRYGLGKLR